MNVYTGGRTYTDTYTELETHRLHAPVPLEPALDLGRERLVELGHVRAQLQQPLLVLLAPLLLG